MRLKRNPERRATKGKPNRTACVLTAANAVIGFSLALTLSRRFAIPVSQHLTDPIAFSESRGREAVFPARTGSSKALDALSKPE